MVLKALLFECLDRLIQLFSFPIFIYLFYYPLCYVYNLTMYFYIVFYVYLMDVLREINIACKPFNLIM